MKEIFISYRRSDTASEANRIHEHLDDAFGVGSNFFDVDGIGAGEDFPTVLQKAVNKSQVVLVIIGDRYVEPSPKTGRARLFDENDFVRKEVEMALQNDKVMVIPVLVSGAPMPGADALPPSIADLHRRNARQIRPADFRTDISKLIASLDDVIPNLSVQPHYKYYNFVQSFKQKDTSSVALRQTPTSSQSPDAEKINKALRDAFDTTEFEMRQNREGSLYDRQKGLSFRLTRALSIFVVLVCCLAFGWYVLLVSSTRYTGSLFFNVSIIILGLVILRYSLSTWRRIRAKVKSEIGTYDAAQNKIRTKNAHFRVPKNKGLDTLLEDNKQYKVYWAPSMGKKILNLELTENPRFSGTPS